MATIHPIRIPGRWREGFALDYHTISSTHLGDDEFGHPIFETKRSELGELLYRLKYKGDLSVVNEIADTAATFAASWAPDFQLLIPVPPSRARRQQPVLILAEALRPRMNIAVGLDCVARTKEIPELKNVYDYDARLRLLQGAYSVRQALVEGRKVLFLDDLFRSGATMNAITQDLYDQGRASEVYALTITRTRSKV